MLFFFMIGLIGFNAVVTMLTANTEKKQKFNVLAKDGGFGDLSK